MSKEAKLFLYLGLVFLILTIINSAFADFITPSLQRADLLAAVSSVALMLVSFLWTDIKQKKVNKTFINQRQGFYIDHNLNDDLSKELAWGSHLFLTATPAVTILVYWNNKTIISRGIQGDGYFKPGPICEGVQKQQNLLSLANTKSYPGINEFDPILEDIPSIIIYPLITNGWIIIGGASEGCFSKSDEKWIKGWADKLIGILLD